MEAARRPRLGLSRRRPPPAGGSPGAARSPLKSSLSDPRPFPGHPFRRTCGARAVPTGCFTGQEGTWNPPPGPCPSARHLIPAGPPGWSSSRLWRVPRPCAAAPCARRSSPPGTSTPAPTCVPLAPKLPPYVWVASEMWGRRHSRKKGIRGASTSSEHFIPQDATRSLSWRSRSVHRVLFPWKMCTLETA
ncbi:FA core complex associated protein 20 [Homo sapiens]|nr:FA core complex associated protein 20 [Homo sapiens]KAI4078191.1 FA core complex associated protein 20 [Homo sapiens]|eukprot:NP_001243874.1 Fanconi anemia core complex-associated protein 20 isoform 3 [Homo sapiens]